MEALVTEHKEPRQEEGDGQHQQLHAEDDNSSEDMDALRAAVAATIS